MFVALRDLASSGASFPELTAALAELLPEEDAVGLLAWAKCLSRLDPDVLTMVIDGRATEGLDTDALLKRIACPVLLLRADPALGGAIEDADAERACSLLSHCTLVHLPGVGHGIHYEQPETFRRLVTDFIESL
jgi:pimeloyl-ACP methyl ester carboxylesterase